MDKFHVAVVYDITYGDTLTCEEGQLLVDFASKHPECYVSEDERTVEVPFDIIDRVLADKYNVTRSDSEPYLKITPAVKSVFTMLSKGDRSDYFCHLDLF